MKTITVIGGGASGLVAAIYAKTSATQVILLERNSDCGKKILATGNGRCNYWNSDQDLKHYNSSNKSLLENIITDENKVSISQAFVILHLPFPVIFITELNIRRFGYGRHQTVLVSGCISVFVSFVICTGCRQDFPRIAVGVGLVSACVIRGRNQIAFIIISVGRARFI